MPPRQHGAQGERQQIPGYRMGDPQLARARLSLDEVEQIKSTLQWSGADEDALRESGDLLAPHVDALLDDWYGFIRSQPPLIATFSGASGEPDQQYLDAVRARFRQWVFDTASAQYDQQWLDYQLEIGRRHTSDGKNTTDRVQAARVVPFRFMFPMMEPVLGALRKHLTRAGASGQQADEMERAWRKSLLLQLTLWSEPYVREGEY